MLVALLPLHQQSADQSAFLVHETLHSPLPPRPRSWNQSADPVKVAFPNCASFDCRVNPQEGMPSIVHNRLKKPASVQSAVSQDKNEPLIWNATLQVLQ